MNFTGRLPDPSRSFVKYYSDLNLSNLEVFESVRSAIEDACKKIESIRIEINNVGPKFVVEPYCQVYSISLVISGLTITINAFGKQVGHGPDSGKERTGLFAGWICSHCSLVWNGTSTHPKSDCPMVHAQYVMES